eukprot:15356813-Ditylum_brightwellii.AAC.1
MSMMDESCLLQKCINAWHPIPRPVGSSLATIRLTAWEYLSADKRRKDMEHNMMSTIYKLGAH